MIFQRKISLQLIVLAGLSVVTCFANNSLLEKPPLNVSDRTLDLEQGKPFLVCTYNEQETFDALLNALKQIPWYKSNGYKIPLPPHPAFKDLEEHPEKIKSLDKDLYFKIFIAEVYKPLPLAQIQKILIENERLLLTALDRLSILNKQWGFKIFPQYKVILAKYGPGGRYHSGFGQIELNVSHEGLPCSYRPVQEIIIHEMVHIGIEDIIVKNFQLTHWEKEGLVDLICSFYFQDLLPYYKIQASGDKRIRECVTYENICNNLPESIKQYITIYPRDK